MLSVLAKIAPALGATGLNWEVINGPALAELAHRGVARG
jgi:3-deoxy-D-arabino-heptulosonate 7-phosphate (DAHP) synthase